MKKYDAIIIGAGQAGTPLAKKLGKAGWKTVIIEKRLIGGTCINDGCMPTKAMIASAKVAYMAANSEGLGIKIDKYTVDLPGIVKRKNEIVELFRKGAEKGLEQNKNVTIIYGTASFVDKKVLEVALNEGGTERISAEYIFIDTGTATKIPEIAGLESVPYHTSRTILDLEVVPEHLLIIGTGYIAIELGQMYRRFGSRVTLLENKPLLLHKEDRDVADAIAEIMKEDGINILLKANAEKIEQGEDNTINVIVDVDGKEQVLACSHLLVAAGRYPQTKELNVDKAGIKTNEKGYITVNAKLETNVEGVYAMGEVNGGPAFTHIAYNDHLIVYKNIVDGEHRSVKNRPLPYCMFTDPELGRIGLSETAAGEQGLNIKVAKLPMRYVGRAIEMGETRGFMKAVVDADTRKILGAAILGTGGGEVMSALQMAMMGGMTYDEVRECVFAHPTLAEALNNLFMMLDK